MPQGFMSVNTKLGAGRAFLRSLHQQYAECGVDFGFQGRIHVKGRDDIKIFMQVLKEIDCPIVYSLSPGVGRHQLWPRINFVAANMIGSTGLWGNSWPDLDMLPLGWLIDPGIDFMDGKTRIPKELLSNLMNHAHLKLLVKKLKSSNYSVGNSMNKPLPLVFSSAEPTIEEPESLSDSKPSYPPLPEEPEVDKSLLCKVGVRLPDRQRLQLNFLRTDSIQAPVFFIWPHCINIYGTNNPLGVHSEMDNIASYPYFYVKDLVGRVASAIFFSIWIFYAPNVLGHPDNYIPANLMPTPLILDNAFDSIAGESCIGEMDKSER
ncbi:hypothetical protein IFM89_012819 [Coptis chinensis]|uniref:Cytochrome b n=1 Tax=Coptis chinensis TaxID=261450 RepID=A0A835H822_9MAGN|nr:hypothetical protein IFM89_012819 [Coptis chinensis]